LYKPEYVAKLMYEGLRSKGTPLGLEKGLLADWHTDLSIPVEGQSLLFTGLLYQATPYIERLTKLMDRLEGRLERAVYWAGKLPFSLSLLAGQVSKEEREPYTAAIRNIVAALKRLDIEFFHRDELDHYSGILLYDLAFEEGFEKHARRVKETLENAGVKSLITIDPHTTYALKVLYPGYVGSSFEVHSYLELLPDRMRDSTKAGGGKIAVHDSCYYSRYLNLIEEPREILEALGVSPVEVRNSARMAQCCGGPAESVSPRLSANLAEARKKELEGTGCPIASMCPICLANFRRVGAKVEDIANIINRRLEQ